MSDYLDKIITKKKDGTQIASVPLQDADAQTRLGTVEGKISTALTPISGNPISISGLKSTQLAVEPVITFEPIQDLHGQSKPYPAGGGKNLIPMTVDSIKAANTTGTWSGNVYTISSLTFTILVDNANNVTGVKVNGTSSTSIAFLFTDYSTLSALGLSIGGSYLLNGGISSTINLRLGVQGSGPEWTSVSTNDTTVNITSESESKLYRYQYVVSGQISNVTLTPMLRLATISDNTFVPYSNISPISGYDKIEVLSQSKNLYADGNVSISNTAYVKVSLSQPIPAGTYKVSAILSNTTSSDARVSFRRSDETGIVSVDVIYNASGRSSSNDILISDTTYVLYFYYTSPGVSGSRTWTDIMIAPSNFDTVYQPYHKTTDLSESLGQTVYGGTLDVRTGKFTVTHQFFSLTGEEPFVNTDASVGGKIFALPFRPKGTAYSYGSKSSHFIEDPTYAGWADLVEGQFITSGTYVGFYYNGWNADAKTWLQTQYANGTPVQFAILLATPFEIQLTPHEISLLEQYAYVSTNGTSIALSYHQGEMASLADVSQLGETMNELGDKVSVKFKTVTDTTSSVGNFDPAVSTDNVIIGVACLSHEYIGIPFRNTNGAWRCRFLDLTNIGYIKNTSITAKIYYI